MSETTEYKCPACGAAMEFDSASQKMKCPYCDTEVEVSAFAQDGNAAEAKTDTDPAEKEHSGWQEEELEHLVVYVCESCGGEITADKNTGATTCPFCGNRVVIKGQFQGDLKPDAIIPFQLDKKAAKAAYEKHLSGKAFVPKVFKEENHIDEIVGVYVPFWLFDADVHADMSYQGEKIRVWRAGDVEYTEHSYYQADRSGEITFSNIPADGSRKMDDALMEAIEPFHYEEAKDFQPAYLAGYVADRYDVELEECHKRARKRMAQSAEDLLRGTVTQYTAVKTVSRNIQEKHAAHRYVLYPVWILNTTWNGEKFTFAMNGQTGKMVGDLPADKASFWRFTAIGGAILGAAIYAVMQIVTLI